ncbi:M15 family metallopeptidase [Nocardioides sp. GY 10127]|uniref:M15 family metallopeptidase n=1 Tax=Nocardioides sp. GY 10127 TaxID=2569762 RepID=UPI0010A8AB7F|nr:M15 family metallopeptidase [Nocardioides sp. GY 10127]TIC81600.1 M15 family metallopeptidase [Nocardioides sp. GY 10127]
MRPARTPLCPRRRPLTGPRAGSGPASAVLAALTATCLGVGLGASGLLGASGSLAAAAAADVSAGPSAAATSGSVTATATATATTTSTATSTATATSTSTPAARTDLALAPREGRADAEVTVRARLTLSGDGTGVADAAVVLRRRTADGGWRVVGRTTTSSTGTARWVLTLARDPARNRLRASFAGDTALTSASDTARVTLVRRTPRLHVSGPSSVVDGRKVALRVRLATPRGAPVSTRVRLQRKESGHWRTVRLLRTDADGMARLRVRPRVDSAWRAVLRRSAWVERTQSRVHRIDNTPPGRAVTLPAAAPTPRRHLPRQARATEKGAHAVVTRIPEKVWSSMVGRTWHYGCPVGRAQLRLLRINYWGYDGYRYRGELVANADVVAQMAAALSEMYRKKLPIRSMYREDRFGWSSTLHGANDYASMAAGNTSAFNCRQVVGRPGVMSPHAYGRALDLNTWENPYRSSGGIVPDDWWQYHAHPRVAWRSSSHEVVRIMRAHGLAWTYGLGDTQHFDAYPSGGKRATSAWPTLPRVCTVQVCD